MSIATAIQAAQQKVADAYTAASAKGATMPATQNLSNLATTISTISGGGVDITGWIPKTVDANGKLNLSSTAPNFDGVEDLGDYVLHYAEQGNTALTVVNFPDLTQISGRQGMDYAFADCSSLASISFPALTTILGGYGMCGAFSGCTSLTSISFPMLTAIKGEYGMYETFRGCTSLTSISFPALKSNSFGSYKSQFEGMLGGVTGCTIHFPSNLDPQTGSNVISSLSGYPNFDGTDTVLAFDLPATE